MALNVYWASCDKNWLLQKKPDLVNAKLNDLNLQTNDDRVSEMNRCPALIEELHNTYNLYSIYDYEFNVNVETNNIHTDYYDQDFFNKYVFIRSVKDKLFSYKQCFVFFTDADKLDASFCKFPFLEENEITKRCKIIPGKYDISKWFRPIEMAFFLKKEYSSFKVSKEDVMHYIQFHTKEKIKLKQFVFTEKLREYANTCGASSNFRLKSLENYYKIFRLKKLILKEINDNLLD